MALRWYKQVWADRTLDKKPASYRLVMLALADFGDKDTGKCNPSVATISEMVGIKERQTQNIIHALADDGYIKISIWHGRSKCNEYTIVDNGCASLSTDEKEKVQPDTPNEKEKVQPSAPIERNEQPEKVHQGAPIADEKAQPGAPKSAEKVHPGTVKGAPECTRSNIDPKDNDDHLPGRLLRAMVEGAGFAYMDRNFNEIALKLEADYSQEQLIRALQSTKEAHQKKINGGERGIMAPLAYMKTVLVGDNQSNGNVGSNGNGAKSVKPKPVGTVLSKAENLR